MNHYDNPDRYGFEVCLKARPDCVPGEHIANGRPHTFDPGLAIKWRALKSCEAHRAADLTGLTDDELRRVETSTSIVRHMDAGRPEAWVIALRKAVWAELTARGYDSAFRKVAA